MLRIIYYTLLFPLFVFAVYAFVNVRVNNQNTEFYTLLSIIGGGIALFLLIGFDRKGGTADHDFQTIFAFYMFWYVFSVGTGVCIFLTNYLSVLLF